MPKTTYGPQIQKRVKRLFEALLDFADGEFEESSFKIEYDWKEDSTNPKLTVKTTLIALELLTQKDKYSGKLTKAQIREALNLLKSFLEILDDNRIQTQGSDDWHFTLKLWSRDKAKNLTQFDKEWQSRRTKKSKLLEADFQKDEPEGQDVPESVISEPLINQVTENYQGINVKGGNSTITNPTFVTNQIVNPFPQAGKPFQAPPLPTYFVERPEYSQDLKARLLSNLASDSRTLAITAIHGLGSVGKSTLAAALAHDKEVQAHFRDGILWATLGQQPDVLPLLSGWVQALGDYNFKPTSVEATSSHLRTLLYDKAVLLVVDDAWNTEDARVFNVGGYRCQVLVTTREAAITKVLGASTYSLDVMKPEQAMELLTKKLGRNLTGTEKQEAEDLAKAVGNLPLALELAAVQVWDGTSWAVLLQDIQQEIARLKSFDAAEVRDTNDEASLKRLSLTASLNLSVQRLPQEEKQNFIWLGILPEDATITPKMTATLWSMEDERDASDTLEYLRSKALVLAGMSLVDGTRIYRLHDLFHYLARNLLTASPTPKRSGDLAGLGMTLANAHATFLAKYRKKAQKGLWHTLPDDGYIHQYLVWHLEKAGQGDKIHQLLREESKTGANGWYEVRERLGQTAGYLTDVSKAWDLAEKDILAEANLSQVVGLQCRYALIQASLNSLAANLPEGLLIALVKKNVWSPQQGLAYALQIPNNKYKANSLISLAEQLPTTLKEQALQIALLTTRLIQPDWYCAEVFNLLVDKVPEVLPEALAVTIGIQNEQSRVRALSNLASKLPAELINEALASARVIQNDYERVEALSVFGDKLPEVLLEALTCAISIQDELYRSLALNNLADKLPAELINEALAAARVIQDESHRTRVLCGLAGKLPEVLPEALACVLAIEDEEIRISFLSNLVDKLTPEFLPEVLNAAKAFQSECYSSLLLIALADKLTPEFLPEAFAIVRTFQNNHYQAEALIALVNKHSKRLPEALTVTRAINYDVSRTKALISLSEKQLEILPEALAAARTIQNDSECAEALSILANRMPELLPEALAAATRIQDEYKRTKAISNLVDKLPPELLTDALTRVRTIEDEYERAKVLIVLAEQLPDILSKVLTAIRAIESEESRAEALGILADKHPEILPEALAAAIVIGSEYKRANALTRLAKKLPPELINEALTAARTIESEDNRAKVLSALSYKYNNILPEAFATVRAIQVESSRANALIVLVDKLTLESISETLCIVKKFKSEKYRNRVLVALLRILPPELMPQAFCIIKEIQSEYYYTLALSAFAERTPVELISKVVAAARMIKNDYNRTCILITLSGKLPELLPKALTTARAIQNEYERVKALISLADKLPEVLSEALTCAISIQDKLHRSLTLKDLADKLPSELINEALVAARVIDNEYHRTHVLITLSNKLPEVMPEAVAAARKLSSDFLRASALSILADKLPELLPEALAVTKAIKSDKDRLRLLKDLAEKIPPELLGEALATARAIQAEWSRFETLSTFAPYLSQIPASQLLPIWSDTLHQCSVRTRNDLLQDIEALAPVIFALGGQTAVAEVVSAILDIARWWP
ncbi:NB-ARC domain-containing protein [Nostoc parmelioides]|uniref:Regulatory protein n=1 Tax=Nostoc parmelioides FACHB-3921 TaxID=2692909 RepID=A0ABR8BNG8_9NOSO|nr:NB-ARC domain-containing protein [Nostoc parmelioides]MBD2255516.1 hypothetical protein [Nostoc parmelioides FACHB-3921]